MPRKRLWIVTRIVDYRLQALADESDPCWEELSGDSIISEDRDAMFQLARRYQGLLCSADGVPSPRQSRKFADAIAALNGDDDGSNADGTGNSASSPASASGAGGSTKVADKAADAENRPF